MLVFIWHGFVPYCRIKFGKSNITQEIPVIITGLFRAVMFYVIILLIVSVIGVFQRAYLILALVMLGLLIVVCVSLVVCTRTILNISKRAFSSL